MLSAISTIRWTTNASRLTRVLPDPSTLPGNVRPAFPMDLNPQQFWDTLLGTIDVAIRILGHTLSFKEGREFICALGPRDAGLCLELLDRVSRHLSLRLRSL